MKAVNLIFPNQLFEHSQLLENGFPVFLVEELLFFKHYNFHKQKIAFHRATMKHYEAFLISKNIEVVYIESSQDISDIRELIPYLKSIGITNISYIDPVDNWLQKRIAKGCLDNSIEKNVYDSPLFLNTKEDLQSFFRSDKKKYHQTSFYTDQRTKRHILIDSDGKPTGGKWTFDTENRKKYPAKKFPPAIQFPDVDSFYKEALGYVDKNFSKNIGQLSENSLYPTNFKTSHQWFLQFLEQRFLEFGTYEDAIVAENSILNHSVLTPMLNIGLITPKDIIEQSITFAKANNIPINSLEGFVRQIIGWREFRRGMYESRGSDERTRNLWGFTKNIPNLGFCLKKLRCVSIKRQKRPSQMACHSPFL